MVLPMMPRLTTVILKTDKYRVCACERARV